MASALRATANQAEDGLITAHVEPHPSRPGEAEWRLKERGIPVWAIIGALTPTADNARQVARDYGISDDAVTAAWAFYRRNQALIDGRLAANRAA